MSFVASATNAKHVRMLADLFGACAIGKRVTHHQIEHAIGRNPRLVPFIVQRARRLANDEAGVVFKSVRGTGYERMPANQAASVGNTFRTHVRRGARGTTRMITNALAKANDLTRTEVLRGWQEITHVSMLEMVGRDRSAPAIPDSILPPDPAATARETLEALRGTLGRRP
ncbi:MAG: hypothetical protein ACYC3L_00835 [Gemmatimonadaceae bacterium]